MARPHGNVPAGALVVGNQGKIAGTIRKLKHKETGKQHPWMSHFSDYYPPEAQMKIEELHKLVLLDVELLETLLAGENRE
ncbi:hypothetical protein LPB072_07120 [Hydrogenophaga crassostreae]|uniref:Uncharacterized protein n=2 Tax=Hydrogenophaga crassostreae TaxID=1763535 RepID=A0A1D8NU72_9BURK|nr:hypothetical protein LPB072_07120 [Hydrogenophaga crassostreae]